MAEVNESSKRLEIPEGIPALYFNTFALVRTPVDLFLMPQLNGQPLLTLNFSYTQAKTLARGLEKAVKDYEERTGQEVLTYEQLTANAKDLVK